MNDERELRVADLSERLERKNAVLDGLDRILRWALSAAPVRREAL